MKYLTFHKRTAFSLGSALILLLCLCLCGCQTGRQEDISYLETKPYITEQQVNLIENITIYAYNEETTRLESHVVQVTVYPDQTRADAALGYLLSMPEFEFALNSYGIPDYTLTVADGIATVRITNNYVHRSNDHYSCFALHFSIVNTLCSIDGISCVSVYAGDSELAEDVYVGPSRFLETGISEHYMEYYGNGSLQNVSAQIPVILYFGDNSQSYIVPEQHQVFTNTRNYDETISAVLDKMSAPPTNAADLIPTVAENTDVTAVAVTGNTMTVNLSRAPASDSISNQAVTFAALYHTLTGIYPAVDKISFAVDGSPVTVNGTQTESFTRDSFTGITGSAVSLYMVQSSYDTLYPVNRYLNASSGISIMRILEALDAGPAAHENSSLMSPFFGGLTINNIIGARVVNDVAIINFDTGFYDNVKNMTKAEETIMVYGIVNTLTSREQINRVQFLINNQSFDTINGHIYYSQPLFSNPGLAVNG